MYSMMVNFPQHTDRIFTLINLYPRWLQSIHKIEKQIKSSVNTDEVSNHPALKVIGDAFQNLNNPVRIDLVICWSDYLWTCS